MLIPEFELGESVEEFPLHVVVEVKFLQKHMKEALVVVCPQTPPDASQLLQRPVSTFCTFKSKPSSIAVWIVDVSLLLSAWAAVADTGTLTTFGQAPFVVGSDGSFEICVCVRKVTVTLVLQGCEIVERLNPVPAVNVALAAELHPYKKDTFSAPEA